MTSEGAAILGPLLQPIIFALAECIDSDFKAVSSKSASQSKAVVGLIQKLIMKVSLPQNYVSRSKSALDQGRVVRTTQYLHQRMSLSMGCSQESRLIFCSFLLTSALLLRQVPADFHTYLSEVEPLPQSKLLTLARKALEALKQRNSYITDVVNFAGRVHAMPAGLRTHSLIMLGKILDEQKQQVLEELSLEPTQRYVCRMLWQGLVRQSKSSASSAQRVGRHNFTHT